MKRWLAAVACAAAVVAAPSAALAHPLGNFTVNRYAELTVSPGEVRVEYVLDLAEVPAFQEMDAIDSNADGRTDRAERAEWARLEALTILRGLRLTVDGRAISLLPTSSAASLLPGQAGLDTLRLEASFTGRAPASGAVRFADGNEPGRIGWREIVVAGDGARLRRSTVPTESVSGRLSAYPEDLLSSPLRVTEAAFAYSPGAGPVRSDDVASPVARPDGGALADLVSRGTLSLPAVLVSLLAAFALGAGHALAPGHGKTLIAAALASGGRLRHAVGTGLAVSLMHATAVGVVGALILLAGRSFAPERLYPWLGLASGLIAAVLGLILLLRRARHLGHSHVQHTGRVSLGALAVSGGLLPSPSAVLVLLAAVALDRAAFGIGLVTAFSLGLATALIVVGIVALRAGESLARRLGHGAARALPLMGAAAILCVGLYLVGRAAWQLA